MSGDDRRRGLAAEPAVEAHDRRAVRLQDTEVRGRQKVGGPRLADVAVMQVLPEIDPLAPRALPVRFPPNHRGGVTGSRLVVRSGTEAPERLRGIRPPVVRKDRMTSRIVAVVAKRSFVERRGCEAR